MAPAGLVEQVAAGQDQEQQLEQQARQTPAEAVVVADLPPQMEVTAVLAAPASSSSSTPYPYSLS